MLTNTGFPGQNQRKAKFQAQNDSPELGQDGPKPEVLLKAGRTRLSATSLVLQHNDTKSRCRVEHMTSRLVVWGEICSSTHPQQTLTRTPATSLHCYVWWLQELFRDWARKTGPKQVTWHNACSNIRDGPSAHLERSFCAPFLPPFKSLKSPILGDFGSRKGEQNIPKMRIK